MKQYEETLNYPSLLVMQINDFRLALQKGKDGSIELENLMMLLAQDLTKDIDTKITELDTTCQKQQEALKKSWEIKTPGSTITKISISPERTDELNRLRRLCNQNIMHEIVSTLYKKGVLLTNNSNMPDKVMR